MFPWGWGAGARIGAVLKWPLGWGPVSPFGGAQIGVLGFGAAGAGEDGGKAGIGGRELRLEAGLEIPLRHMARSGAARPGALFLSLSGGTSTVRFDDDRSDARFWFGRLAFGVGL